MAFGIERVARFCVVLGKAPVTVDDVAGWTAEFRDRGVDLLVITPEQLRFGLQDPRCARLWRGPLGVYYNPAPFDFLEDAGFLAPNDRDVRPTLAELRAGSNDPSPTALAIETLLAERGCAIVRSHGASGKSVLAGHLAMRHEQRSGVAYYLDLAGPGQEATRERRAIEAMADFSDDGVLFIVDNAHLDAAQAFRIARQWQQFPSGGRLLLLGQARASRPLFQIRAPEDVLGEDCVVELRVTDNDLRAIYFRLAARTTPVEDVPSLPWGGRRLPKSWHKFDGDLVVLSLALWARMPAIVKTGDLEIAPQDAREFVRARYFGADDENSALRRVAALSALELRTPEYLVDERSLGRLVDQGAVLREADHEKALFSLAHPRFAELILAADGRPEIDLETLKKLVDEWAPIVWPIARRMDARSLGEDVSDLLASTWERCKSGDAELPKTLVNKFGALQRLIKLGIASEREIDGVLAADYAGLLTSIAAARPAEIRVFFELASEHLRGTYSLLVGAFVQADGVEALAPSVDRGSLLEFDELLRVLDRATATRPVAQALVTRLKTRDAEYWGRAFAATALADLKILLDVGYPPLRTLVAGAMQSRVAAESLRQALTTQEVDAHVLTDLLVAAERTEESRREPAVVSAVLSFSAAAAFRAAGGAASIVFDPIQEAVLSDPEVALTAQEIRELVSVTQGRRLIRLVLSRPELARRVGMALAFADLPTLEALFVSAEQESLQRKLAATIPLELWQEARRADPPKPSNWRTVGYILSEAGRRELDEFMARQLLTVRTPAAWSRDDAFASLIRTLVVSNASRDESLALVEPIATDRFLARAFIVGRPMECARSYLAAWGHLFPDVSERLGGERLVERAFREAVAGGRSARDVAGTLALTGAASLISEDLGEPELRPQTVEEVLRRVISEGVADRLRYHHIVIWSGVRALESRSEAVERALHRVETSAALATWRVADAPTPRLEELRGSMIRWLEAL